MTHKKNLHMALTILLIFIGIFGTSCDDIQQMTSLQGKKKTTEVKKEDAVESAQLAQLILKPKRPKLDISRDPFEPLFFDKQAANTKALPSTQGDRLDDVRFLGLVRVGDTISALIKTKSGKKMYHVEDNIREYKIREITELNVVLTNGQRTIKVKRGVEK